MPFYDFTLSSPTRGPRLTAHGFTLTMNCVSAVNQVLAARTPSQTLEENGMATLTPSEVSAVLTALRAQLVDSTQVWLSSGDHAFFEQLDAFQLSDDDEETLYQVSYGSVQ